MAGATVKATRLFGGTYSAISDSRGIYALGKVPSSSTFAITAASAGHEFKPRTVTTGSSVDDSITVGNLWRVNLHEIPANYLSIPWLMLLLLNDSGGGPGNPILAKKQLLRGYWHFLYTISTTIFERYYALDDIDGSQNSQGGYYICR